MALRSSISRLGAQSKVGPEIEIEEESPAAAGEAGVILGTRGNVKEPAAEEPEVKATVAARGRPRKALGDGAPPAEKPARKPRVARAAKAPTGGSASELRSMIKVTEGDLQALSEQIAGALKRFQPKIDALRAKHAALNAQLSDLLLK